MPTITLNKAALFKRIGRKLRDDMLAERIAMLGTEVEAITPDEVTIEVFPDRPDLLSLQGMGRALRAFIGAEKGLKQYAIAKGKTIVQVDPALKTIRPYTACAVVRKLKLDDAKIKELIDLQEKLHGTYGRKRKRMAMGLYPLNAITPPIRYEARAPSDIAFTPLEFDKPTTAMQILKDHPKGKDYANLLFNCRDFPVFVDDNDNIMSLVPIVNSAETGKILPETKEIFIEVSGHNFDVCHTALVIVCAALADMGGVVETVDVKYGPKTIKTPDFTPKTRSITASAVNEYLGTSLTQKDVCDALMSMGYDARGTSLKVPAWRTDILHDVDIIEDVAIGYGIEKLEPTIPIISTIGALTNQTKVERTLRQLFVAMGYLEMKTFCLSSPETQVTNVLQTRRPVEMENPLNTEYSVLRQQLIPGLLEALSKNKHNEYPQRIVEIGSAWTPDEEPRLAFVVCGEKAGFTDAKSTLETALRQLGHELHLKPYEEKMFISGRAAVFPGGFFGEVHPQVLENFDIGFPVVACEIRLKELFE